MPEILPDKDELWVALRVKLLLPNAILALPLIPPDAFNISELASAKSVLIHTVPLPVSVGAVADGERVMLPVLILVVLPTARLLPKTVTPLLTLQLLTTSVLLPVTFKVPSPNLYKMVETVVFISPDRVRLAPADTLNLVF